MASLIEQTLGQPLTLPCGVVVPNRFVKSAMSENLANRDGAPSDPLIRLYERLGEGGTGLLITGNAVIAYGGQTEEHNVVIEDDRHRDRLTRWASAAQAHGAHAWVQLSHAGRQAPLAVTGQSVAPSAVRLEKGGMFGMPRPLLEAEIHGLIGRFARAAAEVQAAGFSGVQIHGAHGYLVSQFLSPLTNLRTDGWGGDIHARMRFLLEIVRATRAAVGPKFGIGVKLNSADFQRGGFSAEDSAVVAHALQEAGIDLLEISGGTYESPEMSYPAKRESTRQREAYFLEYAEQMRKDIDVPLLVTGGFTTAEGMTDAVKSGAIDLVGLARTIAVQPDLPARLLDGSTQRAKRLNVGVGIRMLDELLQVVWYQAQLVRMGRGQDPKPKLSSWGVLLAMMPLAMWSSLLTRLGRSRPTSVLAVESTADAQGAPG